MSDIWASAFWIGVLVSTVRIATPLLLAALGELIAESSGILNLSIEGTVTLGAFTGFLVTFESNNLWLGLFAAAARGAGIGLAFFWFRSVFRGGSSLDVPKVTTFEFFAVPGLSSIPWVGDILFNHHWLTYFAILMVPVLWIFLNKTKYGLELRSIGHNPEAVDMRGVSIVPRQYVAVVFGGLMAGLAGAFLSLASTGLFFPDIASGRGWIALAIVIFGNWRATWILIGSLFFGFIDAMQLSLQATGEFDYLPYQLLLALVLNRSRSRSPLSLAISYHRGER